MFCSLFVTVSRFAAKPGTACLMDENLCVVGPDWTLVLAKGQNWGRLPRQPHLPSFPAISIKPRRAGKKKKGKKI